MKKKYAVIAYAGTAIFYAVAIGFLIHEALGDVKNWAAFFALVPIVLTTPVLLTIFSAVNVSSYFVFYDDLFEYHKLGKSVSIQARNLRYFYFRDGMLTVFFVKDSLHDVAATFSNFSKESLVPENAKERALALPADKELFKTTFPALGLIQGAEEILSWFYEHIPIYPDGQALIDSIGIYTKYDNPNPDEVNVILVKAELYARRINWFSAIIAVWVALYPKPYFLSVALNLLCPVALLFVLHFSNGWIHFDKKGNSIYPCVCLALIAPTFGLGWRMLQDFTIISAGRFLKCSAVFYAMYLILFIAVQKEYSFGEKYTYGALAVYSFFFFAYALAAVCAINCAFDFSQATEELIEKNNETISVLVHRGLLGIGWYAAL
ncbi:MAG: hypothetical protein IJ191_07925 [Treponema sp.]|nr:hypothetical protein [Treponema sp.]